MVEVVKNSDKVIFIKVVLEDMILNIVGEYAPQVGYEESYKSSDKRWMRQIIQKIHTFENIVVGGDINGQ